MGHVSGLLFMYTSFVYDVFIQRIKYKLYDLHTDLCEFQFPER